MTAGQFEAAPRSAVAESAVEEVASQGRPDLEGRDPAGEMRPISPFVIFGELWDGKYLILGTALLFLVLVTVRVAMTFNPVYVSTALLEKRQQPGAQATMGNSLLARLTETQSDPLYQLFMAELDSLALAERIQDRYHILQKLYPKQWDAARQQWVAPKPVTWRERLDSYLAPYLHVPPWQPPDAATLQGYIARTVIIDKNDTGPLFHISYSNPNRQFSHDFLNIVITEVDALLKQREENDIARRVALLDKIMANTTVESYRTALLNQAMSSEILRLVIQADSTYAVDIIHPVQTPAAPSSPRWNFFWGIAFAAGLLVGILLVFVRSGIRQYRRLGLGRIAPRPGGDPGAIP